MSCNVGPTHFNLRVANNSLTAIIIIIIIIIIITSSVQIIWYYAVSTFHATLGVETQTLFKFDPSKDLLFGIIWISCMEPNIQREKMHGHILPPCMHHYTKMHTEA